MLSGIHIVPTSDPRGKAASKSRNELTLLVPKCLRFHAILSTVQRKPLIIGLAVSMKEIRMNKKNLLLSGVVVFIAYQVLDFVTHEVLMKSGYDATEQVWRPQEEMMSFMWIFIVVNLLWSFIFVYLFDQMNKGKGIQEGIKYGFCIGLFVVTPMACNTYAILPVPHSMALGWFVYGMIKVMACGAVLSLVHKPVQAAS